VSRNRLQRYGGIWPITEDPNGKPAETVKVAGYDWELYTGWNGDMRVYSFLPPGDAIHSFSADVLDFFDFLTANYDFPASNQYMLSESPQGDDCGCCPQKTINIAKLPQFHCKRHSQTDSSLSFIVYNFGSEAFTGGPTYFDVPKFQADVQ
jgi:xyloglucan-specific endo-beta-1,4-glucanase